MKYQWSFRVLNFTVLSKAATNYFNVIRAGFKFKYSKFSGTRSELSATHRGGLRSTLLAATHRG
jgi:hypothetical protein